MVLSHGHILCFPLAIYAGEDKKLTFPTGSQYSTRISFTAKKYPIYQFQKFKYAAPQVSNKTLQLFQKLAKLISGFKEASHNLIKRISIPVILLAHRTLGINFHFLKETVGFYPFGYFSTFPIPLDRAVFCWCKIRRPRGGAWLPIFGSMRQSAFL